MGTTIHFVPRLVESFQQIATLIGGVVEQATVRTTSTVIDEVVEHTPDPIPPADNLIDQAAMGLGERGEIRGGTSVVDAVTEYVGGGGEHTDNCVDYALHRAMSYAPDADVELRIYGDGDDGHAIVVVDGQAFDPFDMQPIALPDEAPTGIVTRAQLEVMVQAGYDALAARGATTGSIAGAVANAGRSAGVEGVALQATANGAGETYHDAAAVQTAIDSGISLAGATFAFDVSGFDFGDADLTGATFELGCTNCTFHDGEGNAATLDGVTFKGNVQGAQFGGASMVGATFELACIGCAFYDARGNIATLDGATFKGLVHGAQFGEASMVGARFESNVEACSFFRDLGTSLYPGANLRDAQFLGNVTDSYFYNCDLTNAGFAQGLRGCEFIAATLDHTVFNGEVTQCLFEYARFTNAAFNSTTPLFNNDFYFATGLETVHFEEGPPDPRTNSMVGTVWPPIGLVPQFLLFGSDTVIEDATGQSLETLAENNALFAEVERLFPGAMDLALTPAWRSVLYDQLSAQMAEHGYPPQGDQYFDLKRFVFDATDDRYSQAPATYLDVRPDPAPTLAYLYNLEYPDSEGESFFPFRDAIDQALLRMLRSNDVTTSLDAPFGESVPSYWPSQYLNGSAHGLLLDAWLESLASTPIQYNGVDYHHDQIPLDEVQRDAIRERLSGDDLARFEAIAGDGVVTVRDLREAGLDPALSAFWSYCGGL